MKRDKLFVYGIFLDEHMRKEYGMVNPRYDTVLDYLTRGGIVVRAEKVTGIGLSLTGLLVDIDPKNWKELDRLEAGYDRVFVTTVSKERAFMYVKPERGPE